MSGEGSVTALEERVGDYFVEFRVGPKAEPPAPEDHEGLLLVHLLDADRGVPNQEPESHCRVLTWWASRPDFDRARAPLTRTLGGEPRSEGYVRRWEVRHRSWWRRVGVYNLFIYAVAVGAGIISLHEFYQWLFQPPRWTVTVDATSPLLADPYPLAVPLLWTHQNEEVASELRIESVHLLRVESSTVAPSAAAAPERGESGRTVELRADIETLSVTGGGSRQIWVRGGPVEAGRYRLRIRGSSSAGRLRTAEIDQTLPGEIRVWAIQPRIELGPVNRLERAGAALLPGTLLSGNIAGTAVRCSLVFGPDPQVKVGALAIPGKNNVHIRRSGKVSNLTWDTVGISQFEARPFSLALFSSDPIDWARLAPQPSCTGLLAEKREVTR